jgi:hypothetical protein
MRHRQKSVTVDGNHQIARAEAASRTEETRMPRKTCWSVTRLVNLVARALLVGGSCVIVLACRDDGTISPLTGDVIARQHDPSVDAATLTINKQTIGPTGTFDFVGTGASVPATFSRNTSPVNPTMASAFPIPLADLGTKYVQETVPNGWTVTNILCTNLNGATVVVGRGGSTAFVEGGSSGFDPGDNTLQVNLVNGSTPLCLFINTPVSSLDIEKQTVGGTASFDFTGSIGISPFSRNTAAANPTTTAALNFSGTGAVGDRYVQETTIAGWTLTAINCAADGATIVYGTGVAAGFNQGATAGFDAGDNSIKVTLAPGTDPSCTFVNTKDGSQPPGGGGGGGVARGIGYWRNWSSCSGGKQYEKALAEGNHGKTLDFFLGAASLYPIGNITSLTCEQAIALLSKGAVDGSSRAGDPIYNMVAQLLSAKLNQAASAGTCPALPDAFTAAQTLLLAIGFDGNEYFSGKNPNASLSDEQRTQAITLTGQLASSNEGSLGGGCPSAA